MLAANLTTSSLTEAVSDTFDGVHPCPLCKVIKAGKKTEQKSEALTLKLKFEFLSVAEKLVFVAPTVFRPFATTKFSAEFISPKPPLPPPRNFII